MNCSWKIDENYVPCIFDRALSTKSMSNRNDSPGFLSRKQGAIPELFVIFDKDGSKTEGKRLVTAAY